MPSLFGSLNGFATTSAASSHAVHPAVESGTTTGKGRKSFLRSSFFNRPAAPASSLPPISYPLERLSLASAPSPSPSHSPTRVALPPLDFDVPAKALDALSPIRTTGGKVGEGRERAAKSMSSSLLNFASNQLGGVDPGIPAELQVSLLPSALSRSSIAASQAGEGADAGCISASTSRNTILPAVHPVIAHTAARSTFVPPSNSLELGPLTSEAGQKSFPSLASAINLPSPAPLPGQPRSKTAETQDGDTIGRSIIIRKPPPRRDSPEGDIEIMSDRATSRIRPSSSSASTFSFHRLKRVTSRSSVVPSAWGRDREREQLSIGASSNRPPSVASSRGERSVVSLGRRISRKLSIDSIRPIFSSSTRRRSIVPHQGVSDKIDIRHWAPGPGVSSAHDRPSSVVVTATAEHHTFGARPKDIRARPESVHAIPSRPKAKERLALPGIRSWRSKFTTHLSSSAFGTAPTRTTTCTSTDGSVQMSARGHGLGHRDSWVDVGSTQSVASGGMTVRESDSFASPTRGSGAPWVAKDGMMDAMKRVEAGGPIMPGRVVSSGSEHENQREQYNHRQRLRVIADEAVRRSYPVDPLVGHNPLAPSERRSQLLETLLSSHFAPAGPVTVVPGITRPTKAETSPEVPVVARDRLRDNLSPARDDLSILDPSPAGTPAHDGPSPCAEPSLPPGLSAVPLLQAQPELSPSLALSPNSVCGEVVPVEFPVPRPFNSEASRLAEAAHDSHMGDMPPAPVEARIDFSEVSRGSVIPHEAPGVASISGTTSFAPLHRVESSSSCDTADTAPVHSAEASGSHSPSLPSSASPEQPGTTVAGLKEPVTLTLTRLPRSRSKSTTDLASLETLIERTEREQGEGWWSVSRPTQTRMLSHDSPSVPYAASASIGARGTRRPELGLTVRRGTRSAVLPQTARIQTPGSVRFASPPMSGAIPATDSESCDKSPLQLRRQSTPIAHRALLARDASESESIRRHSVAPSTLLRSVTHLDSPRRSALRPSRLLFPAAVDETPVRPPTRRTFRTTPARASPDATNGEANERYGQSSVEREMEEMRARHTLEIEALLSALTDSKAEFKALREEMASLRRDVGGSNRDRQDASEAYRAASVTHSVGRGGGRYRDHQQEDIGPISPRSKRRPLSVHSTLFPDLTLQESDSLLDTSPLPPAVQLDTPPDVPRIPREMDEFGRLASPARRSTVRERIIPPRRSSAMPWMAEP